MRILFYILLTVFVLFCSWAAVPSKLFFDPKSVQIEEYRVTLTRSFPLDYIFGPPLIQYVETVRNLDNPNDPCIEHNGSGFRYDTKSPVAVWSIEDWAAPCMTGDYEWRAIWRVKVAGILPLLPVEKSTIVRKSDG